MSLQASPPPPTVPIRPHGNGAGRVGTILRKEFREIFRDRRTLLSVILGPLVITPGLLWIMGIGVSKQIEKTRTQTYAIGVVGEERSPLLSQTLRAAPNLKITPVEAGAAETQIKDRKLSAAVVFPPDARERLVARRAVPVTILQDEGSESSQAATGRLRTLFADAGKRVLEQRLRESRLPPEFATPFEVTAQPIAQGGSAALLLLSGMLPYVLILSAFTGAIYAAFDQVAGEKERGTLETLLVSPASRRDIVLGKFGAVVGVCLISGILSIVGFALPFVSGLKAFAWLARGQVHLGPTAIGAILLAILPLSVLFAGLLLALSTWARNQKEAQTYLGSLFPIIVVPALFSMFLNADVSRSVALIPILNASLIIKQALTGSFDPVFLVLAFAASAAYAALALWFATMLFQRESVLIKA